MCYLGLTYWVGVRATRRKGRYVSSETVKVYSIELSYRSLIERPLLCYAPILSHIIHLYISASTSLQDQSANRLDPMPYYTRSMKNHLPPLTEKWFACELQTKNIHVVSTLHCKILACYSSAGFFDFLKWSNLFFNPSPTFFPVVLLLRMLPSNSEYFIELPDVNPVVSAWLPLELR